MREPDAGRYMRIRPRRLRPERVDGVEALADKQWHRRRLRAPAGGRTAPLRGGLVMQVPDVHIESIRNPRRYTYAQIDRARGIAHKLGRGKLVLFEPPE